MITNGECDDVYQGGQLNGGHKRSGSTLTTENSPPPNGEFASLVSTNGALRLTRKCPIVKISVRVLPNIFLLSGGLIMRITSKGQVTIPLAIRQKVGLLPNTEVDFVIKGNTVQIVKAATPERSRGSKLIARLRGKATVKMSTDDIMALTRGDE